MMESVWISNVKLEIKDVETNVQFKLHTIEGIMDIKFGTLSESEEKIKEIIIEKAIEKSKELKKSTSINIKEKNLNDYFEGRSYAHKY